MSPTPPYPKVAVGYAMTLLLLFALLAVFTPNKHRHDDSQESMRSGFLQSSR